MATGYFDRKQTIRTHEQMMAKLHERTSGRRGGDSPSEPPSVVASPSTPAAEMPLEADRRSGGRI